ncbi:hypothetical protein Tco_0723360 [Tanacetum coccineum]
MGPPGISSSSKKKEIRISSFFALNELCSEMGVAILSQDQFPFGCQVLWRNGDEDAGVGGYGAKVRRKRLLRVSMWEGDGVRARGCIMMKREPARGVARKCGGNGADTNFWYDCWVGDIPFCVKYSRLFALELDKQVSVESKLLSSMESSFRRNVRGGIEQHMLEELTSTLETVSLSNSCDRWICDLTSDGVFRVKEVQNCIDDIFLPSQVIETRWVRFVPIKVNIFILRG